MVNIIITQNTASTFKFKLVEQVTFTKAVMWMSVDGAEEDIYLDEVMASGNIHSILSINQDTGEIGVDLNMLPFDSIYYKRFYMVFLDDNDIEVDRTKEFTISPDGKEALYGIVNKLSYEFTQMTKFSGTTVRLFLENPTKGKCPECWDFELNQRISSVCTCQDQSSAFDIVDILCRKVKTESKQIYTDKGTQLAETAVFQTYARADFIKGTLFVDTTDKQFYSVIDRKIANIGGVRTSTMFTGQLVKPNDSRVAPLLNLL